VAEVVLDQVLDKQLHQVEEVEVVVLLLKVYGLNLPILKLQVVFRLLSELVELVALV
jgi:hypothetical protein